MFDGSRSSNGLPLGTGNIDHDVAAGPISGLLSDAPGLRQHAVVGRNVRSVTDHVNAREAVDRQVRCHGHPTAVAHIHSGLLDDRRRALWVRRIQIDATDGGEKISGTRNLPVNPSSTHERRWGDVLDAATLAPAGTQPPLTFGPIHGAWAKSEV